MPAIALLLLPLLHTLVVDAAPPAAPLMGFTATPDKTYVPPTPTPVCDNTIEKRVDPRDAETGELVTFTIHVENVGQVAMVNARVEDTVPDYLEVLNVEVLDEHFGQVVHPLSGQTVTVQPGILGPGAEVTIIIRTKVRNLEDFLAVVEAPGPQNGQEASEPAKICVDNVAYLTSDNCPDRTAVAEPCFLPETGGRDKWWVLAAGLATSVLVLSLVLVKRRPA
jgi:uncharacterized repeat protein (TIGR01451 family)/LPXTG-motif cell wall-anchored protein